LAGRGKVRYAMSRRFRRGLIAAVLLAGVLLVLSDHYGCERFRNNLPVLMGLRGEDVGKYHLKSFRVVKVVDGDTVDINIADGEYATTRVRLLGVDTPETKRPGESPMYYGEKASSFTAELVLAQEVTIVIDTVSDVRDRYGRLLGYVRFGGGRVLNEELIVKGFGYADLRFDHSDYDRYVGLQEEAIEKGVGLWRDVRRDQVPKWLLRERPGLLSQ
jgi:endonuclease YncB( thermonuclease family)